MGHVTICWRHLNNICRSFWVPWCHMTARGHKTIGMEGVGQSQRIRVGRSQVTWRWDHVIARGVWNCPVFSVHYSNIVTSHLVSCSAHGRYGSDRAFRAALICRRETWAQLQRAQTRNKGTRRGRRTVTNRHGPLDATGRTFAGEHVHPTITANSLFMVGILQWSRVILTQAARVVDQKLIVTTYEDTMVLSLFQSPSATSQRSLDNRHSVSYLGDNWDDLSQG